MGFPFTGRLPLGEICEYDSQCMGNLSQCLQDELKGRRVCSCLKGYIAIGNECYKGMYFKRKRRLFKSLVLVKNIMKLTSMNIFAQKKKSQITNVLL